MININELTRNQLEELADEWSALSYALRNSFFNDPQFQYTLKDGWLDDYEVIKDCLESVTLAEDNYLKTEWLMDEIKHEMGEYDADCE